MQSLAIMCGLLYGWLGMFNRIEWYITKEWLFNFLAVMLVLVMVAFGSEAAALLAKSANGDIPAELVIQLILLKIPTTFELLLPLSVLLSVLMTLGRFTQDQELVVMQAAGLGVGFFVRLAVRWMWWLSLLGTWVILWLTPWAFQNIQQLMNKASDVSPVSGLVAQQFTPFQQGAIYAESITGNGEMRGIVIDRLRTSEQQWIFSERGQFETVDDQRWLVLHHGVINQYVLTNPVANQPDYQQQVFDRLHLPLETHHASTHLYSNRFAKMPMELWQSADPKDQALLQWRLAAVGSLWVMALWGIALSKSKPREGRFGRFFIAILLFILFYNFLYTARVWLETDQAPLWLGPWWVPLAFALPLIWQIRPNQSMQLT